MRYSHEFGNVCWSRWGYQVRQILYVLDTELNASEIQLAVLEYVICYSRPQMRQFVLPHQRDNPQLPELRFFIAFTLGWAIKQNVFIDIPNWLNISFHLQLHNKVCTCSLLGLPYLVWRILHNCCSVTSLFKGAVDYLGRALDRVPLT